MKTAETTTVTIKTIDIQAFEWFDKVNGNSYFAAIITTDFGTPEAKEYRVPFEYGYGDFYIQAAAQKPDELGVIPREHYSNGSSEALWRYCQREGIILRKSKQTGCKKAEVKAI